MGCLLHTRNNFWISTLSMARHVGAEAMRGCERSALAGSRVSAGALDDVVLELTFGVSFVAIALNNEDMGT